MWQCGHQAIVSYEEDMEVAKHCELWPAIPYWWGNKTATRALIQYLEHMKQMGRPGKHGELLGGNKGHVQQRKTHQKLGDRSITGYNHFAPMLLGALPTHGQVQHSSLAMQIHASVYVHA